MKNATIVSGKRTTQRRLPGTALRRGCSGILVLLFYAASTPTTAQYFGRNKVQYESFDFQVMDAEPFSIYYYPPESTAVNDAARMLYQWNERFTQLFGTPVSEKQPVILYADHADFQQTNVISGRIPQSTGGVTEGLRNRVVIPLTGVYAENDHVLGHELVHVYHYAIMKSLPGGLRGARGIPLWFIEGMSEYLSLGSRLPLTTMWLRDALIHNDLPTIQKISRDPSYFPYRYGHALWAFIAGMWGDTIVPKLYYASLESDFDSAVENLLGISVDSLSKQWRTAVKKEIRPTLKGRINPSGYGRPVVKGKGGINLSPEVSPDGRSVVFFSNKDLFSISLYLADLETGKIKKKLVKTQTNPHFDALRFMDDAGAWSPDGKQFAFIVYTSGDNAVRIIDVASGKTTRSIRFENIESVTGIAWSPDGGALALCGTSGGISDMYMYNLSTDLLVQLTDDRYAEMQPSWSPDGKTILFSTDRHPVTSFDSLTFSRPQIGVYHLAYDSISVFGLGPETKHLCPHFSADASSIYFVANPDGFSDIFRYSLDDNTYFRITRMATGVSGLTGLSPSFSMAQKNNTLVFNVFENRDYNIYVLTQEVLQEEAVDSSIRVDTGRAVVLPPRPDYMQRRVNHLLAESFLPTVEPDTAKTETYEPHLSPLAVGGISVGGTVNRFGAGLGGGAHLLFSDILGNHLLGVMAQVNGSFQDAAAQVLYQNRARRLNWIAGVSHIPYHDVTVSSGTDTVFFDTRATRVQRIDLIERLTYVERVQGVLEYPLNVNRRFEFTTGYSYSWTRTRGTRYRVENNHILGSTDIDPPTPGSLHLFESSAAFVGDFSTFGFTAPIRGRRYRLEVEPTVGSLNFVSLLTDYRHYLYKRPITFAARILHYGRYFEDGENDRLSPLHIGYPTLVRGYEPWTFDVDECNDTGGPFGCAQLDRLFGSRIAVGNIELRLAFLGVEGHSLLDFRFLPMDVGVFGDVGVAWNASDYPEPEFDASSRERIPVASSGVFTRLNLAGVLVLQFYYANIFQRIGSPWRFGWVIAPGW